MNFMSFINKISPIVRLMMVAALLSACTKLCRSGYEGSHCNDLSRPKFVGTWSAVDTPGNLIYTDTISNGSGVAGIIISKSFAGNYFSHAIYASASGPNITIAAQKPDSNLFVLQGTGTISTNDSIIFWSYQITKNLDSPVTTNYSGIWTK